MSILVRIHWPSNTVNVLEFATDEALAEHVATMTKAAREVGAEYVSTRHGMLTLTPQGERRGLPCVEYVWRQS